VDVASTRVPCDRFSSFSLFSLPLSRAVVIFPCRDLVAMERGPGVRSDYGAAVDVGGRGVGIGGGTVAVGTGVGVARAVTVTWICGGSTLTI
jgi:hypothetical protein